MMTMQCRTPRPTLQKKSRVPRWGREAQRHRCTGREPTLARDSVAFRGTPKLAFGRRAAVAAQSRMMNGFARWFERNGQQPRDEC